MRSLKTSWKNYEYSLETKGIKMALSITYTHKNQVNHPYAKV